MFAVDLYRAFMDSQRTTLSWVNYDESAGIETRSGKGKAPNMHVRNAAGGLLVLLARQSP